jgi:16S rRNA (guanine(966)-N(2))-methyltransferase RsmD
LDDAMRVIAGEFRRRVLKSLPGDDIRPTPDRLREALFNVLAPRIAGVTFLDAYAGTGAVGIEALSRGAGRVVFIEHNREAVMLIRENLTALGILDRADVVQSRVVQALRRFHAQIVFIDPPYPLEGEYGAALNLLAEDPPELVIAQHATRFKLHDSYRQLKRHRTLRQGDNTLSFFSPS